MKLASEQEVLELLSLSTTTQSTTAVGAALETATAIAGPVLGTDFDRKTRLDRFRLTNEARDLLYKGREAKFLLQDGFLVEGSARVYASSALLLQTADSLVVDRDSYLLDEEQGVLTLIGTSYWQYRSVAVQYECGFEDDGDTYIDIPQWLKQATISSCIEVLRSHVITKKGKDGDNITEMTEALTRDMRTVLYPRSRPRYNGAFPMNSRIL